MMGLLRGMIESQQEQTTLLREGLISAQQTVAAALDKAATPREVKPGNVYDFLRMRPATFAGVGTPLEVEQ